MHKHLFSFVILAVLLLAIAPTEALAADSGCKQLYGGGTTNQQACNGKASGTNKPAPTATKAPSKKVTPAPAKNNTTKGGLPVLSPTPAKKTPSTGPEVLGIIALVPAAAVGLYLRKRS